MPVIPPISWSDFWDQAESADIIVFSGTSRNSQAVEIFTDGPYAHTAMVVVPPASAGFPAGTKWLWETDDAKLTVDPLTGEAHEGAQLGELKATLQYIKTFGDSAYFRKLDYVRPAGFDGELLKIINQLEGRPFPSMLGMFVEFELGEKLGIDLSSGSLFCSALAAVTYQSLGLLGDTPPANSYTPSDWSAATNTIKPLKGNFLVEQLIEVP